MKDLIRSVIVSLISGIIGTFAGGIVYDATWAVGDYAVVNINECNTLPNDSKVQCEYVKSKYDAGKNLFHLIGFIVTFGGVLAIFRSLS